MECLRLRAIVAPLLLAFMAAPTPAADDKPVPAAGVPWNEEFAYLTGMQAYIYGFPAIMYANLRQQWVASGKGPIQMAVNDYWHSRELSDPKLQYGGSPNRETPYSLAMLDLAEPMVLTVPPNPSERYYTLQLMDFYSDTIGYIGVRATKNVPGDYLVTGPGWKGEVPAGIKGVIPSWTRSVMIAGRTYTDVSEADMVKMRAHQDGYRITPLSRYGKGAAPTTAARRDVMPVWPKSDPLGAFKTMNAVMKENPLPPRDAALMTQFALVGLGPLAKTALDSLDPAVKRGLQRAIVDGDALLSRVAKAGGSIVGATKMNNGWFYGAANWGRTAADGDFLARAGTQAYSGITEHLIEESVKMRTFVDADGAPLSGDQRYVIRFSKEQIPVARSFWSVTLYDDAYNLVYNEAGRYSFGDKVPGLVYGADGSLEIYIQADRPEGAKAANWLPSAKGKNFNLFLRTYFPGPTLLDQSYVAPPVRRVVM